MNLQMADGLLALHALIVFFNVGALPVIWIGHFRGWHFVRNFHFRAGHLLLLGIVAAESVLGIECPLTLWEEKLRVKGGDALQYQDGYVAHWLHRLIFHDIQPWVFALGYSLYFALVVFTLFWIKPRAPKWWPNFNPKTS